jgi:hypothetical protein
MLSPHPIYQIDMIGVYIGVRGGTATFAIVLPSDLFNLCFLQFDRVKRIVPAASNLERGLSLTKLFGKKKKPASGRVSNQPPRLDLVDTRPDFQASAHIALENTQNEGSSAAASVHSNSPLEFTPASPSGPDADRGSTKAFPDVPSEPQLGSKAAKLLGAGGG